MFRKILLAGSSILLLVLITAFATTHVFAQTLISSEDVINIDKEEVIDDDLFVGGENVNLDGTVNGDVYIGGGYVDVTGTINGDLIIGGGEIRITGVVNQDIRIAGGDIYIYESEIKGSVTAFGGIITIDDDTSIGGSLVSAGGTIKSDALVGKGIVAGGGTIHLGGEIQKDVIVGVGRLIIKPNTIIHGKLDYYSDQEASISPDAQIDGEVTRLEYRDEVTIFNDYNFDRFARNIYTGFQVWFYLSALLIGLLVVKISPKLLEDSVQTIRNQPLSTLGWGVLLFIGTPIVLTLLMFTLIGIPLSMLLFGLYVVVLYLSKIFIGMLIGQWMAETLNRTQASPYLKMALGLGVYYVLTAFIIVAPFVFLSSIVYTLGALFKVLRTRYTKTDPL